MGIVATRDALSRIFYQRCFWLFAAEFVLIGVVSFTLTTRRNRGWTGVTVAQQFGGAAAVEPRNEL